MNTEKELIKTISALFVFGNTIKLRFVGGMR